MTADLKNSLLVELSTLTKVQFDKTKDDLSSRYGISKDMCYYYFKRSRSVKKEKTLRVFVGQATQVITPKKGFEIVIAGAVIKSDSPIKINGVTIESV